MNTDKKEILNFIKNFNGAENVFLNGCCYWFAFILLSRFGGEIKYFEILNHFVTNINGRLYDISGDVTEKYKDEIIKKWEDVEDYDPSLFNRIVRDCILKKNVE